MPEVMVPDKGGPTPTTKTGNLIKYWYPEDIGMDHYENRRITFGVTKAPTRRKSSSLKMLHEWANGNHADGTPLDPNISIDDATSAEEMEKALNKYASKDELTEMAKNPSSFITALKDGGIRTVQTFVSGSYNFVKAVAEVGEDDTEDPYNTIGKVQLPLPAVFNIDNSHSWSQQTGVPKYLAGLAQKAITGVVGKIAGEVAANHLGDAVNYLQYAGTVKTGTQYSIDPAYWLLYNGTAPRTLAMTFNFLPLNHDEAENVLKIIEFFKSFASPRLMANKIFMKSPYMWSIEFDSAQIGQILNFDNCALTNIQTTVGDSSEIGVYKDGMPKFISMSLTFQETEPPYRNDTTEGERESTPSSTVKTPKKDNGTNETTGKFDGFDNYSVDSSAAVEIDAQKKWDKYEKWNKKEREKLPANSTKREQLKAQRKEAAKDLDSKIKAFNERVIEKNNIDGNSRPTAYVPDIDKAARGIDDED